MKLIILFIVIYKKMVKNLLLIWNISDIFSYFLGFNHSAFTFAHESLVVKSTVAYTDIPPGALITFLQKGLEYVGIEEHINEVKSSEILNFIIDGIRMVQLENLMEIIHYYHHLYVKLLV